MQSIRVLAQLALLLGATVVQAQSFELRPGTGTSLSGTTFVVAPGSGSFQVEIWANLTAPIVGWSLALAFDTTTGVGTSAVRNGGPLAVTGVTKAPAFAGWTATDDVIPPNRYRAAPNSQVGSNASLVSGRAFVSYTVLSQLPASPVVNISGSVHVLTATVAYDLSNGSIFGDSLDEAGLFLFNSGGSGNPAAGASGTFGNAPSGGLRLGSQKYQVQAVPEPASLLTLLAGAAALVQRRKIRT